jgi:nucleoside-diphosphate-sugar epimerase
MLDLRCFYSDELRTAVTGGTGYVGNGIIELSGQSFRRVAFGDVPNGAVIVHCAASVAANSTSLLQNVEIDVAVVEAVNLRHAGIVYASTNNVFPLGVDHRAETPPTFLDHYGAGKAFGEMLIRNLGRKPFCIARIGDVFGAGQRHGNFFRAIEAALRDRTSLKLFGEGSKLRSYIYNQELGRILLHFATEIASGADVPATVNVCYPDPMTVREIVTLVAARSGLSIEPVAVANDQSARDIRTMTPGPFGTYKFAWPTFADSLADYIARCSPSPHAQR